jgi:hypothetical protein
MVTLSVLLDVFLTELVAVTVSPGAATSGVTFMSSVIVEVCATANIVKDSTRAAAAAIIPLLVTFDITFSF